jgi:hypothetical protein
MTVCNYFFSLVLSINVCIRTCIRNYRRFNTEGRELTMRMTTPPPASGAAQDPARCFADSVDELFDYSLRDLDSSDMVGISIHNADNQQDRPIGLSLRRKDHMPRNVLWRVFEKVTLSKARFQALDTITFHVHSLKMPVGFEKAKTSKRRPRSVMAHLRKSIVEVKAELSGPYPGYCYCQSKQRSLLQDLQAGTENPAQGPRIVAGVDLSRGGGIPELQGFQSHLSQYRRVYSGLRCDSIMFDGQVPLPRMINLLYD